MYFLKQDIYILMIEVTASSLKTVQRQLKILPRLFSSLTNQLNKLRLKLAL